MRFTIRIATAAAALMASAGPSLASWGFWRGNGGWHGNGGWQGPRGRPHAVPEIDASTGLLAFAAVAAMLLFAWERSRRRG